ncbi:MAG: S8 family serine peptidase [Candidatus Eremiobacteraeota bacterium]|nr:S8 family serine peptidase [Candidatus Eremiobacteraeota bacterium]
MKRSLFVFAFVVSGLALAACGGGGSSGGGPVPPPPSPTATPVLQLMCNGAIPIDATQRSPLSQLRHTRAISQSTYTFSSNPSGLPVLINAVKVGATNYSMTPAYTAYPYIGKIQGPANSFSVCYSQLMDGNHTVFYNTQSDTSGHLGSISAAASTRTFARLFGPSLVRRGVALRREGGVDRTRIQVHFVTSSIRGDARVAAQIEHSEGAPSAFTLGKVGNFMNRIVWIPRGQTPESFAAKFRRHSEVADARPLPLRYAQSVPNDPCFVDGGCYGYTPFQWDFQRIDTPDAWNITHGLARVAIVDTGADLSAKDVDLPPNVIYQARYVGSEPPEGDNSPGAAQDYDGHGTNVSGIADAVTDNGYGFAGVAFNSSLIVLRIFPKPQPPDYTNSSSYGASTADEAMAVDEAVAKGAKVINLSLGSCPSQGAPDPTEFDAIEAAIAAGVSVVAAAGNERSGQGSCGTSNAIDFPAAYPGVIAVGATSLNGTNYQSATEHVSSYSNSGPGLSVVAPGGDPTGSGDENVLHWIANLYSFTVADPSQQCKPLPATPPLCAALFAGTSQATPHVTGTVALMRSVHPSLSPATVKSILQNTADNINDPNQGFGRVNSYRAVAAAAGITTNVPGPNPLNFRAIAYTTNGGNKPIILDETFPAGVPVQSDGSFRIADVPQTAPPFNIALWYDANGNGIVDAGDYFGSAGPCNATSPCAAASKINVRLVPAGFQLR